MSDVSELMDLCADTKSLRNDIYAQIESLFVSLAQLANTCQISYFGKNPFYLLNIFEKMLISRAGSIHVGGLILYEKENKRLDFEKLTWKELLSLKKELNLAIVELKAEAAKELAGFKAAFNAS